MGNKRTKDANIKISDPRIDEATKQQDEEMKKKQEEEMKKKQQEDEKKMQEKKEELEKMVKLRDERMAKAREREKLRWTEKCEEEKRKREEAINALVPLHLTEDCRLVRSRRFNQEFATILNNASISNVLHPIIISYCQFPTKFGADDDWTCLLSLDIKQNINYNYNGESKEGGALCPDEEMNMLYSDDLLLYLSLSSVISVFDGYSSNLLMNGKLATLEFEFTFDQHIVTNNPFCDPQGLNKNICYRFVSRKDMIHMKILYRFWRSLKPSFSIRHFAFHFYNLEDKRIDGKRIDGKRIEDLTGREFQEREVPLSKMDENIDNDSWWNNEFLVAGWCISNHGEFCKLDKMSTTLGSLSFDSFSRNYGWDHKTYNGPVDFNI